MARDYDEDVSPTSTHQTPKMTTITSPPATPPQAHAQQQQRSSDGKSTKAQKHTIGHGGASRLHSRATSNKTLHLHKSNKGAANTHPANVNTEMDPFEVGRLGLAPAKQTSSSTTNLKKNNSHASLRRNRSSVDVPRRPKSGSSNSHEGQKKYSNVRFEIGDKGTDKGEGGETEGDGWEEASSSASPTLSRSAASSAKNTGANNSRVHSAPQSPTARGKGNDQFPKEDTEITRTQAAGPERKQYVADAKVITERLLQRTPSYNTTKMSLATAVPSTTVSQPPVSPTTTKSSNRGSALIERTPTIGSKEGEEVVSRFVSGSGTPRENATLLQARQLGAADRAHARGSEDVKRAQSMGNLARRGQNEQFSDGEDGHNSALAPRSRNSSTANSSTHTTPSTSIHPAHAYVPPQQSRTQQKLWLQRASSNIEPHGSAQMIGVAPATTMLNGGPGSNGISAGGVSVVGGMHLHGLGLGAAPSTPLLGAGGQYGDTRDPRIKLQLERTGLEFLVIRRHQDPVGKALKRGEARMGKGWRIPQHGNAGTGSRNGGLGHLNFGLSQSLKETGSVDKDRTDPRGRHRSKNHAQAPSGHAHASTDGSATSNTPRTSYDGNANGHGNGATSNGQKGRSQDDGGIREGGGRQDRDSAEDDDDERNGQGESNGISALLRGMWEKTYDFSSSAD